ncbi:CoA pyrophosphatase [Jiella endophytica]|uniref:CoA pyrophosphatase n=1 Tax=Jiella endophytica TaxID=2558362 RepID=A0A4Y8RER2_9HYPH|nr:CoA pyrophosphatase [Jiella endophytica]TFF20479.1 CoA pyrophosphatase [Jiella endophytica]
MTELQARALTAADLRARFAALGDESERFAGAAAAEYGDHRLNPDLVAAMSRAESRRAAVLVPVVDRGEDEATVILTTRTRSLRQHSGQIALPGGAIDDTDASPEAAAMREAMEEVALDPRFVEPIGRLPRYLARTGFHITPVVGVVAPGFVLEPNPGEVEDVFEVPLGFLMDAANHRQESRVLDGLTRHYFTMPFGERFIWGVTAGIIRTLYERYYA